MKIDLVGPQRRGLAMGAVLAEKCERVPLDAADAIEVCHILRGLPMER